MSDFAIDRPPCHLCELNAPHHTVGEEGIGDSTRRIVWDIHEVSDSGGVGLAECTTPNEAKKRYLGGRSLVPPIHPGTPCIECGGPVDPFRGAITSIRGRVYHSSCYKPYQSDHIYYTDAPGAT